MATGLNKWQSCPNSSHLFSIQWPEHSCYESVVSSLCSNPSNGPLSRAHLWAPARAASSAQSFSPDHFPAHFLTSFVFIQRSPAQWGLPGLSGLKLQSLRSSLHGLFFSMTLTSIYSMLWNLLTAQSSSHPVRTFFEKDVYAALGTVLGTQRLLNERGLSENRCGVREAGLQREVWRHTWSWRQDGEIALTAPSPFLSSGSLLSDAPVSLLKLQPRVLCLE